MYGLIDHGEYENQLLFFAVWIALNLLTMKAWAISIIGVVRDDSEDRGQKYPDPGSIMF